MQDEKAIPLGYGAILTGYVEIHHNLAKLRKGQVAVALNGCSKLIGVDQVTCTMLDVKGETVDMPSANQIAIDDSDVTGND